MLKSGTFFLALTIIFWNGIDECLSQVNLPACGVNEFVCHKSDFSCIPTSDLCNILPNCPLFEDEEFCNIVCLPNEHKFYCTVNGIGTCMPSDNICDGTPECDDGRDEQYCRLAGCNANEYTCPYSAGSACRPGNTQCNGVLDCPNAEDERGCTLECTQSTFRCWLSAPSTCIHPHFVSDGYTDCPFGEDEIPRGFCPVGEWSCLDDGQCHANSEMCDGTDDCGAFISEELFCGDGCGRNAFVCHSSDFRCIPASRVCDANSDCPNGEDEDPSFCNIAECAPQNQFYCLVGGTLACLSQNKICDQVLDCADGFDELYCKIDVCIADYFTCPYATLGSVCTPGDLVCDGTPNCPNGEDEQNCTASCGLNNFVCYNSDFSCLPTDNLCTSEGLNCPRFEDDISDFCSIACLISVDKFFCQEDGVDSCIASSRVCDGIVDCDDARDEQYCQIEECNADEFTCPYATVGSVCLAGNLVCDGVQDCPNGEDEKNCTSDCFPGDFSCWLSGTGCQLRTAVCNGIANCPLGEDEFPCNPRCEGNTWYCLSDDTCKNRSKLCDGNIDCFGLVYEELFCEEAPPPPGMSAPEVTTGPNNISFSCSAQSFVARIPESYVRSVVPEGDVTITFVDGNFEPIVGSCFTQFQADTYIAVSLMGMCAARRNDTNGKILDEYKIQVKPTITEDDGPISHNFERVVITLDCQFLSETTLTLGRPLVPVFTDVNVVVGTQQKEFRVEMARYQTEFFAVGSTDNNILEDSVVYVALSLAEAPGFTLLASSCSVSANEDGSGLTLPLIDDGCPTTGPENIGVQLYLQARPDIFAFSFPAFLWNAVPDAVQNIWITCTATVCPTNSGSCDRMCTLPTKRRRSVNEDVLEEAKSLSLGPFTFSAADKKQDSTCDKDLLGCSHFCNVNNKGESVCSCPGGLKLMKDMKTCSGDFREDVELLPIVFLLIFVSTFLMGVLYIMNRQTAQYHLLRNAEGK